MSIEGKQTEQEKQDIDEAILRIMAGASVPMDQKSVEAAVRLVQKIEQHRAFIGLLQSGQLVARPNAEGTDVFYAREFDPEPDSERFVLAPASEGVN